MGVLIKNLPLAKKRNPVGFTIVELLIVVVVIAILASITIIAYNGVRSRAQESLLKNDLSDAAKQLGVAHATNGQYPSSIAGIQKSSAINYQYYAENGNYCLTASVAGLSYFLTANAPMTQGTCNGHTTKTGSVVATESFTGANGAGLPGQWGSVTSVGTNSVTIQTNQARFRAGTTAWSNSRVSLTGMQSITDTEVSMSITMPVAGVEQYSMVAIRADDTAGPTGGILPQNGYAASFYQWGYTIFRVQSGTQTTLVSDQPYTWVANTPNYIWFSAIGGHVELYINSSATKPAAPVATATDASPLPAGKLRLSHGNGSASTTRDILFDDISVKSFD